MSSDGAPRWRRRLLYGFVACSPALLVVAYGLDAQRRRGLDPRGVSARLGPRPERCLACHRREARGMAKHHSAVALGCSSCHLGNPLSLDKARAHRGLERFPGDLTTAARTCGRRGCHPDAVRRTRRGLMATARGILSVLRFVLGERETPDSATDGWNRALSPQQVLEPRSPAEALARKLCASCHLATRHLSAKVRARGGGCGACHLQPGRKGEDHPQLRLGVSPKACTGCHARSGRISLSYYGWHEGVAEPGHAPRKTATGPRERRLPDGRRVRRARADVHAAAGMTCLDCHTSVGLMGDGARHRHEEEQVDVACTDCHGERGVARTGPLRKSELAAIRVGRFLHGRRVAARPRPGLAVARTARGTPLWGLRRASGGGWVLRRRVDGRALRVRPTPRDVEHGLPGHERLTCQACHTDWTHQCDGCHTRRDASGRQWDSVAMTWTAGRWHETPGPTRIGRPTLGVTGDGRITPFIPGMPICSGTGSGRRCRRLFAATDPHTTQRAVRSCRSCHASGHALGLGSGTVELREGRWRFVPSTAAPRLSPRERAMPAWPDGVGWDGWTTLTSTRLALSTRRGARPFSPHELRRILRVGLCLGCHRRADDAIYVDFPRSCGRLRKGSAPRCRLPAGKRSCPVVESP